MYILTCYLFFLLYGNRGSTFLFIFMINLSCTLSSDSHFPSNLIERHFLTVFLSQFYDSFVSFCIGNLVFICFHRLLFNILILRKKIPLVKPSCLTIDKSPCICYTRHRVSKAFRPRTCRSLRCNMLESELLDRAEENSFGSINRIAGQWRKLSKRSLMDEAIQKIDDLNLYQVREKIIKEEGWTIERCAKAEQQYRQFLKLMVLVPSTPLVPTPDVDEVWHTHILFTRKYHRDCQEVFGKYIHHNPSEGDGSELHEAFQETTRLFLVHFGVELPAVAKCLSGCCHNRCNGCAGQK